MKTDADLRAYCESRFPVGTPTAIAWSVTGEEYVVIGQEEGEPPGVVREARPRADWPTPEDALISARVCFDAYASDKSGTLYWRWPPQLEEDSGRWRVYMRCLISDKPAKPK